MVETFHSSAINWTWYACIELVPGKGCRILQHGRLHSHRHVEHPDTVGAFRMVETDARIVTHIDLAYADKPGIVRLAVLNSEHVFSYPGFASID